MKRCCTIKTGSYKSMSGFYCILNYVGLLTEHTQLHNMCVTASVSNYEQLTCDRQKSDADQRSDLTLSGI